jgi:SulP family sulfate permease
VTENIHKLPPVVVLRLRNMTALDATGLFALEEVAQTLQSSGRSLILCGAREQPLQLIQQSELPELIGRENISDNVLEAIQRAEAIFEKLKPAAKGAAK